MSTLIAKTPFPKKVTFTGPGGENSAPPSWGTRPAPQHALTWLLLHLPRPWEAQAGGVRRSISSLQACAGRTKHTPGYEAEVSTLDWSAWCNPGKGIVIT